MNDSDSNSDVWSLDGIKEMDESLPELKEEPARIRKFINSAIYVEKPVSVTTSSGDTSVTQKISSEYIFEIAKTKRCTCISDPKSCPCHLNTGLVIELEKQISNVRPATVARKSILRDKPSMCSTSAKVAVDEVKATNQRAIQNKTANKKQAIEKKKPEIKIKEKNSKKDLTKDEREALLAKERENFKNWLLAKKKKDEERRKKKVKCEEEEHLKVLEKEKRQLENKLNFQLWLKKKEEANLEKKIKEQIDLISELELKERNVKDNESAFNEWLKTSKNKQKPIPNNRGIESLRSSTSVAYINPNPWHPNT